MNYQKLNQAFEYAAEKHHDLRYFYNDKKFQVAHIFFVGAVLIKHGFSDEVVIAGVLHDVVEDTDATIEEVEKKFGKKVAELVEAETVDQSIEWKERQLLMQDNVRNAIPEVKAIKIADLFHHLNLFYDESHVAGQSNYIKEVGAEKAYWKYDSF